MTKRVRRSSQSVLVSAIAVLLIPVHRAAAQRTTVWRGLSRCIAADHPCHDEQVIYRVAEGPDSSRRIMSAAKIVGADTIEMGTLTLAREVGSSDWVARLAVGVWRFQIGRDSLTGTLTVDDGAVMRRVSATHP